MAGLRIGVNALYLIPGGVGGTEIYLRSLLRALGDVDPENRYIVYTNRETDGSLIPDAANFAMSPQPIHARNRPARIGWEQSGLPRRVARDRIDVLFNPGFTCPILAPCPNVTVFHDLQHKRHPEHFRRLDLPFWRMLLYGAARRSAELIAVSEETRCDLLRYYPLREDRITVVPHGVDERFFEIGRQRGERLPEPFLLCVSTLHPHKNLARLVRAFEAFRAQNPRYRLVIAGLRGFYTEELERLIAALKLEDAVRLTGWIPREDLYQLFLEATAFLYPSTFEGFGMPVLEALAAGIPAACSKIEPLRSIAGEAALQFAPEDEGAIADAMRRLTCDEALREELKVKGPQRAALFSWRTAAQSTVAVLTRAAAQRRTSSN